MISHGLCKLVQRQTYSCLSNKFGIYLAYAGIVVVLFSIFHFGEEVLSLGRQHYNIAFNLYHDNIVSKSFQHRLSAELPIDLVYTWVNGSDPLLLSQLNELRFDTNVNTTANFQTDTAVECHNEHCILLPLLIMSNLSFNGNDLDVANKENGIPANLLRAEGYHSTFFLNLDEKPLGHAVPNVTILRYSTVQQCKAARASYGAHNNEIVTLFHITTNSKASYSLPLPQSLMLTSIPNKIKVKEELLAALPSFLSDKLNWIYLNIQKNVAFLWLTDTAIVDELRNEKGNSTLKNGFKIDGSMVHVHLAYFIGLPESQAQHDHSRSRFEDNEELRYSLRSVEKFAPWIRQIFIVTNGQIPYWLDLDALRMTVVTHEEIFLNKTHLPTFSSPAIEAHIHRIPGLADRFIYMNDDVMFGKPVWPDDFYTASNGQKVYLSWPVPNCAEGCAPTWIHDGFCDAACNISDCSWDGGDCAGENIRAGVGLNTGGGGNNFAGWQNPAFSTFCKAGCSDHWLADKFCDQACNCVECGFDAGDCGLTDYHQLVKLPPLVNGSAYRLPPGRYAAYVELQQTLERVTAASYTKSEGMRAAAVSNKFHVLTLLFNSNANHTEISVALTGIPAADDVIAPNVTFAITIAADPSSPVAADPEPDIGNRTEVGGDSDVVSPRNDVVVLDVPEELKRPRTKSSRDAVKLDAEDVERARMRDPERLAEWEAEVAEGLLTRTGFEHRVARFFLANLTHHDKGDRGGVDRVDDDEHDDEHRGAMRKQVAHLSNDQYEKLLKESKSQAHNPVGDAAMHSVKSRKVLWVDEWQRGFLPWERDATFRRETTRRDQLDDEERSMNEIKSRYETSFRGRKPLDAFADSLRHVSNIYNRQFGFSQRKVPAHMPHFIDKKIMVELQDRFPQEFALTSSHKLRHSQDMQFAFSYFYYMMSEEKVLNCSEIFDQIDTDGSGVLSDREIRLLSTQIFELPLSLRELTQVEDAFKTCAFLLYSEEPLRANLTGSNLTRHVTYHQPLDGLEEWARSELYYDKSMPLVTREVFLGCPFVVDKLNSTFGKQKKYKYEEMDQSEVAFKMIRDNVSTVVGQLDDIRKKHRKFVCLNDNINHNLEEAAMVKAVIRDFLETLFPLRSSFELPHEFRNRFERVEELRAWRSSRERTALLIRLLLLVFVVAAAANHFSDQLDAVWRRRRRWRRMLCALVAGAGRRRSSRDPV